MPLTTHLVTGKKAERVLLFMHGFGADEKDLAGLLPHLDPEGRFVAVLPRAQYSGPVGYAWYQLGSAPAVTASQLRTSLDSVEEVFTKACDDHGMRKEDAIVGGFSQGGSLAMALAYGEGRLPRPAGVLVMSGFMAPDETYAYDWTGDPPPALVQHGTEDPMVPVQVAQATAWTLRSAGVPVTYRTYPMEHQVAMESIADARSWIDAVRRGERPDEPVEAPDELPTEQPPSEAAQEPPPDDGRLVRDVSAATFDREVLQSDIPVIVDFWAPWCAPCRAVSPLVEQIAAMRQGSYKVVKLNIDEAPAIAQKYQVQSIPLIGLFRNGRLERQSMGAKPRPQIEAELGMLVIP